MQYIKNLLNECGKCKPLISNTDFIRLMDSMQSFFALKPAIMAMCAANPSEMELLYTALDYAAENGRPITAAKAAHALNVSSPAISRTLRTLSERGLVRRDYDNLDRRSVRIEVTEAGERVFRDFLGIVFKVINDTAAEFSDEDLSHLIDMHVRLVRSITNSISKMGKEGRT